MRNSLDAHWQIIKRDIIKIKNTISSLSQQKGVVFHHFQ